MRRYRLESSFGRFRDIVNRAKLRCKRVRESDDPLGINDLYGRDRHLFWLLRTSSQREANHNFALANRAVRRLIGKPQFAAAAPYRTGRQKRIERKRLRKIVNG